MWHAREKREMYGGYWWRNLKERAHLEYVAIDVQMIQVLAFMLNE
jgi:predicted glycosyltransferase involved in capsule biosynthesis